MGGVSRARLSHKGTLMSRTFYQNKNYESRVCWLAQNVDYYIHLGLEE